MTIDQAPGRATDPHLGEPDRPHSRRGQRIRALITGWGFVGPATVVILGLSLFPAGWALLLSLQKWNGFTDPTFVGTRNYAKLVGDSDFLDAIGNTGLYTVLFVPASVP